jgi:predicted dehydrogenase
VLRARALIAEGGVGDIELFRASWTCGFHVGREWPAWRFDRARGGGAFNEIAVHHLDLLRYLLADEIHSITAETRSDEIVDQCVVIDAKMRSGAMASLSVSQRTADGNDIQVYGRRGVVSLSCYRADSFTVRSSADLGGGVRARLNERGAWLRGFPAALSAARNGGDFTLSYAEHWRRFARSIRDGEPLPATLDDGERALEAVLAAVQSAECGVRVDLTP